MYNKILITKHKVSVLKGSTLHELLGDLNNVPAHAIVDSYAVDENDQLSIIFHQEVVEKKEAK